MACILTLVRQEALRLLDNAPRQGCGRHLDATPSEGERGLEKEGRRRSDKEKTTSERLVGAMIPLSHFAVFFFFPL